MIVLEALILTILSPYFFFLFVKEIVKGLFTKQKNDSPSISEE